MSVDVTGLVTSGTFVSPASPAKIWFASAKGQQTVGASYESFIYTNMPAQLAGKTVLAAELQITTVASTGSKSLTVQRHVKASRAYASIDYNTKPGVMASTTAVTVTQSSVLTDWVFNVTADVQNIAASTAGNRYYGWRVTSSAGAAWFLRGWQSTDPPVLVVTLSDDANEPGGLRPDGTTALAKPVLTWNAVNGLISARAEIDSVGDDFSSPLFNTGQITTTEGEIDLAATAFTGITDGTSVDARVFQTTDAGESAPSERITITRDAYATLTITGPAGTTTDPTPTASWTFTGQARYQVTVTSAGATIADSGVLPGTATAYTPPKGATANGQVLTFRVRVWDAADRTSSPGDPGYVEATASTTYNPGSATAVTSLTVTQDGLRPWVDLAWVRATPDEYLVIRDGEIIDRFAGTSGGSPVLSYRDWTCPPNRTVTYTVRPVIAGAAGAAIAGVNVRTVVTGAWVIAPDTGEHFSISGDSLSLAYAEQSVVYEPVGGSVPIKRTFAMRGLEGSVGGALDVYDGRTVEAQETDLYAIKARPSATFRFVEGDVNIPAVIGDLTSVVDVDRSLVHRITKQVGFSIRQDGELPFPEVTP